MDRDLIREAIELFPENNARAAEYAGCCASTIGEHRLRLRREAGLPNEQRRGLGKRAGEPRLRWNETALEKLQGILERIPRPGDQEIADEMGCTVSALHTARSKYGFNSIDRTGEIRKCLCCAKQFGSEGIHDRLCDPCGSDALEVM